MIGTILYSKTGLLKHFYYGLVADVIIVGLFLYLTKVG